MRWSCASVLLWTALASGSSAATRGAQESRPTSSAPASGARDDRAAASPLEAEVVANIKERDIGTAKVADLDLPDDYLHRVAGRILRASFEQSFRVVVQDAAASDASTADARGMNTRSTDSSPDRSQSAGATDPQKSTPSWLLFIVPAALAIVLFVAARSKKRRARAR
jgi:hypothetical protein